ncbi:MAG: response regulator [Chthoniobacteraceae bacterium]
MNIDSEISTAELQLLHASLLRDQLEVARERERLSQELAGIPRASRELATRMVKLEETNLSIRQARDLLLTRNHELIAELARANDKVAEVESECEDAVAARDAAIRERDRYIEECVELRRIAAELGQQITTLTATETKYAADSTDAERIIAELTEELAAARANAPESEADGGGAPQKRDLAVLAGQFAAAQQARTIALKALEKAKAESERIGADRDALRSELAAAQNAHEQQLTALRAQLATAQPQPVTASASGASPAGGLRLAGPATSPDPVSPAPLGCAEAGAALATMRDCLAGLAAHPDDLTPLDALDNHLRAFSEGAHAAELAAVHRYAVGCRELTRWLRKSPKKIAVTLPTLNEALDLLGMLTTTGDRAAIPDPVGGLVYSVDDDVDNCECIAAGLEKMMLFTKYASKPEIALVELAAVPCDLIILDVNMPGMDGFEIFERVRQMEHHRETPILFVSGLNSARERLNSIKGERIEFVAKPYNLNELGLKALGMILRAAC